MPRGRRPAPPPEAMKRGLGRMERGSDSDDSDDNEASERAAAAAMAASTSASEFEFGPEAGRAAAGSDRPDVDFHKQEVIDSLQRKEFFPGLEKDESAEKPVHTAQLEWGKNEKGESQTFTLTIDKDSVNVDGLNGIPKGENLTAALHKFADAMILAMRPNASKMPDGKLNGAALRIHLTTKDLSLETHNELEKIFKARGVNILPQPAQKQAQKRVTLSHEPKPVHVALSTEAADADDATADERAGIHRVQGPGGGTTPSSDTEATSSDDALDASAVRGPLSRGGARPKAVTPAKHRTPGHKGGGRGSDTSSGSDTSDASGSNDSRDDHLPRGGGGRTPRG